MTEPALDLFGHPLPAVPARAGPAPGSRDRLTEAQARALGKAVRRGAVMAAGGFGGRPVEGVATEPAWDRRAVLEGLVARKLLAPGKGANSYAPTKLGRARWRALRLARELREAKGKADHGPATEGLPAREAIAKRAPARPDRGQAPRAQA